MANLGLIIVLVATAMPLLAPDGFTTTRIVYTVGAALAIAGRLTERFAVKPDPGEPVRLQRMKRLETWSALMFGIGALFMYLRNVGHTDWIAFTLAGGVLTFYTSLMIPRLKNSK